MGPRKEEEEDGEGAREEGNGGMVRKREREREERRGKRREEGRGEVTSGRKRYFAIFMRGCWLAGRLAGWRKGREMNKGGGERRDEGKRRKET